MTEHLPRKAERSQRDDKIMIERHILPIIGKDRRVAEVHHGDICAMHRAISETNGKVRANRVLTCASKMFSLSLNPLAGEAKAWRDQALGNPCKGVPRNPEEPKDRFFCEAELSAISDALAAVGRTTAADCIRFIMLTGCRPSEAILATWSQLDAQPGLWVKPSSHTKQRKTHRVPLNPVAQELIQRLRKARNADSQPTDYIFPGLRNGKPLQQLRTCWVRACAYATVSLWESSDSPNVAKLVADLARKLKQRPTVLECQAEAERRKVTLPAGVVGARVYDLRHSFASIGAGGGLSLPIIGKLLGHTTSRSTQRYAHLADDPLREATEKIGKVITGAGNGADLVRPRGKT
jgi:integrase